MKTVQIVVYSCDNDEILSVGDFELPSKEFDEQQQTGHEAANDVLENLGMECAMWSPLMRDEKTEIWQALLVSGIESEDVEIRREWVPQMIASDFIDCKTNGLWRKKMLTQNIPQLIADDILHSFNEKQRGYLDDKAL